MNDLLKKLSVRIQNPKVIVAVVSGVLLILSNTGIITIDHANYVNDIMNTFLSAFVGLGVFGNPESHVTNKAEIVDAVLKVLEEVQANKPVPTQTGVFKNSPNCVSPPVQQVQVVPVTPSVLTPVQTVVTSHSTQIPSNTNI
jgi:uncharacterized membrane protein